MTPDVHVVRIGEGGWPRRAQLAVLGAGRSAGAPVAVLGPDDGLSGVLDLLVAALDDGVDAVSATAPVTDALVLVESDVVAAHLDRDRHALLVTPQLVSGPWWDRIVELGDDDDRVDPALEVARGGGTVRPL